MDFAQFQSMPLDGLLEVTASKEPVPGGGGIAAMTAASAAALVEMVANLTIGKKGYDEIEKLMVSIRDKAHGLRQRYLDASLKMRRPLTASSAPSACPRIRRTGRPRSSRPLRMRLCRPLNWARTSSSSSSWQNKSSATATPGSSRTRHCHHERQGSYALGFLQRPHQPEIHQG